MNGLTVLFTPSYLKLNKKCFLLYLFIFPQLLFAQNQIIDSLSVLLKHSVEDTSRIDLLNELSWEFYPVDLDKCVDYANQALDLSDRLNYLKGKSRAYNLLAIEKSIRGNNHLAYKLNQKALALAQQINDLGLMSNALNDMAIYHAEIGNSSLALENYQKSLEFALEVKDTLSFCITLSNISRIHHQLGNTKESIMYAKQCGSYYSISNDPKVKLIALNSLGHNYCQQKDYEAAREKYKVALQLAEEQKDQTSQMKMLQAIGRTYCKQERKEIAIDKSIKALKIAQSSNRKVSEVYILHQLSFFYLRKEQLDKGIQYAQSGLNLAKQIGLLDMQYVFNDHLAQLHEKQHQYKMAFQHLNQAKIIKDSLKVTEQEKQALALEAKYQNEKKEMENKLLREEASKNEAILRKRRTEFYVTILGFTAVSLLAALLYFAYREKNKFNKNLKKVVEERTRDLEHSVTQLEKSNAELESFAYIASHDLKEPIRNISSFTKLAMRELKSNDEQKIEDYLSFVAENAIQMHSLVEDVLEYSKIGHSTTTASVVDLNLIVEKVEQGMKSTLNERKAILLYDLLPKLYISPTPIFILLKNLIENGFKYNESQPPIVKVSWERINESWQRITVTDNGIGIEPEYQSKIFEMFKRLHNRSVYKGSGLGLAICKKIVSNLGGRLNLESTPGEGSQFYITLPIIKAPKSNKVSKRRKEMV